MALAHWQLIRDGEHVRIFKESYQEKCASYEPDKSLEDNLLDFGSRTTTELWKCSNYDAKGPFTKSAFSKWDEPCYNCHNYARKDLVGPHMPPDIRAERRTENIATLAGQLKLHAENYWQI